MEQQQPGYEAIGMEWNSNNLGMRLENGMEQQQPGYEARESGMEQQQSGYEARLMLPCELRFSCDDTPPVLVAPDETPSTQNSLPSSV